MYIGNKFIGSVLYYESRHTFQIGYSVNGGSNQYQTLRVVAVLWREPALSLDRLRQILILEDGSQWARMRKTIGLDGLPPYEFTDWYIVAPEYHVSPFEIILDEEESERLVGKLILSGDQPIGVRFTLDGWNVAEVLLNIENAEQAVLRKEEKKIGDRKIEQIFVDDRIAFTAWKNKLDDEGFWDFHHAIQYLFMEYRGIQPTKTAKPASLFFYLELPPTEADSNVIVVEDVLVKKGYNLKWIGGNRPDWIVDEDGTFGWFASRTSAEYAAKPHNRAKADQKPASGQLNIFGFVELSD